MKIALVILHADPARGGAERYTVDLAAALKARGHEVALLAGSFAAEQTPEYAVRLDAGGGTRTGRYMQFLDALDRHLAAHRYDVVHAMLPVRQCDVYHPHAGIAAEAVRNGHLKYEGPVMQLISQVANRMDRRRQRFAQVEKALLTGPRSPTVICLSQYVKKLLLAHYAIEPARLATLFNATDLRRFDPALRPHAGNVVRARFHIGPQRLLALMIAQDYHRKGLAEAIMALAKVDDQRLVLLVVGKQDATAYVKLAQRHNVGHRVFFAGGTDDPYTFYRSADMFVLPTRHDPCSLVVLEALAMGVPVISTVFNGACEIMENGRHGLVLPDPADVAALAVALRQLLNDTTRAKMAQACAALRPQLAYDRHIDGLLEIYRRSNLKLKVDEFQPVKDAEEDNGVNTPGIASPTDAPPLP